MRHNPDTFDLRIDRDDYGSRTRISWRSRRYDFRYAVSLRDQWGNPRPLADFIERFVGGTLRAWEEAGISPDSGREMAQALAPHWEREIHRYMEHLERRGRAIDHMHVWQDDRIDALRFSMMNDPAHWWSDGPREDPKAKEKARQLLLRNLDAGQEKSFKKDGTFRVTAKDGKAYTIKTARSFNVTAEDGTRYCGQTADTPVEDQMLAQKLLLEHEPEKFFKNANVSPASGGDVGFVQSGSGINLTTLEMMRRPRSITGWDTSV